MINVKGRLIKGPYIVREGLVLYLDAGNTKSYPGSGTTWSDLSGRGNTGTLTNGPTYSSANGGSIVFDGVDDLTSITSVAGYNMSRGTINMWIYPTGAGRPFMQYNNDFNRMAILYDNSNQRIEIFSGYSTLVLSFVTTTNSAPLNTWSYISYLYNFTGDTFEVYVDGKSNATTTNSTVPTPDAVGEITLGAGKDFDNPPPYYMTFSSGRIANTSIYNRLLTAAEVLQNYNALRSRFGK